MLLNRIDCVKCNEPLEDFYNYKPNFDHSFYGGRISMLAECKCECGNIYKIYLEDDKRGGYRCVDIELKSKNEPVLSQTVETLEPPKVEEHTEPKVVKPQPKTVTIKTKVVNNSKSKKK